MSEPIVSGADTWKAPRNEGPGGRIGIFKILQQIGEGGYGEVFEAEQQSPVKRRVALKVIKLGMDTRDVIARFEAERQALAMMDHPHIARVLDAGATDSGRPYFVMELVKGEPMARYCDKHKLSILVRLKLFEQVCAAVQHAHTKGIIHRDLKPSNVLVSAQDDEPFAKVIDFGIAKATSGRLTDKTLLTELHQVLGTPLYMSPEQAEGSADIDTRTDIYSLGVMLYELLTGTTPVQSNSLRSAVVTEIQRIICEVEPQRPSVRLSHEEATTLCGVATQRAMEPRKLTRMVQGELDWIVMKALEKDRTRRYQTANGLAMDVRRYLAGEPVLAAPPSASYRAQKFVRRHKGAVVAGSLVAISLLVGIAGFAWQAHEASARAHELEQVSKFQADMLGQIDTTQAGKLLSEDVNDQFKNAIGKGTGSEAMHSAEIASFAQQWDRINATDAATNLIDRTILKPAVAAIDKQFKGQPIVDAALRQAVADRYADLGLYDAALPLQESALSTRRRMLGNESPETLVSIDGMGTILQNLGRLNEAERFFAEGLQGRRRVLGSNNHDTIYSINNMAVVLQAEGKIEEAEPYFSESLEKLRATLGSDHPDTLLAINNIAVLLKAEGRLDEAERYFRESLERSRRTLPEEHPQMLTAISGMGVLLSEQGKFTEAEPYFRESLEKTRKVYGETHPETLREIIQMGSVLRQEEKFTEAEPYHVEAMEKSRKVLGEDNPDTLVAISNMGLLMQKEGRLNEAQKYYQEALEKSSTVLGEMHPKRLVFVYNMGALLDEQGKYGEAEKLLVPYEGAVRKAFSRANAFRLASYLMSLGRARAGLGEFSAAEAELLEAHQVLTDARGPSHKNTRECAQAIVDLYASWNVKERGKGYDQKSSEWKANLEGF